MTFEQFCQEYKILPNLKDHLLDVASLTALICRNYKEELPVSYDDAIKAAILHDIGNMAKSDPDTLGSYLDVNEHDLELWKDRLKAFKDKYGYNDHEVTQRLLRELKVPSNISQAIQNKSFGNIIANASSDDLLVKLISYADLRINPNGIVSVQERLEYIKNRYPKYSEREDFDQMCQAALDLELEVQKSTNVDLQSITSEQLKTLAKSLNLVDVKI